MNQFLILKLIKHETNSGNVHREWAAILQFRAMRIRVGITNWGRFYKLGHYIITQNSSLEK